MDDPLPDAAAAVSPSLAVEASAPLGASDPRDRYAVLRIRDFQLYLFGRFVAALGQQMLGMAIGWEIYERTRSSLALGMVGLAQITPMLLFTLPAGHIADQRERRGIILAMQVLIAVNCAGLALVSWGQAPVAWMYLFLFIGGTARAFVWPASGAYLPQIVPRTLVADAITWNSGSFQLAAALGPALGGAMIAATRGAASIYALNIAAALFGFGMLWLVKARPAMTAKREKMSLASLRTGFRFVIENRIVFGTISLDLFAVLLGGVTSLLPVYAKDILHVGPHGLGWLQGALPVGSVAMALFLAHRPPMERAGRNLLWAVAGFGLATIIFGFSRSFWVSLAMMFLCGAMDNISVVVRHTLVQILTPDEMRGRVSAVNSLFIGSSNEFGSFESGLVASWLGPVFAVVSGGVGTILVVAATALIWPEIRRFGRLDRAGETSAAA
jgi:MFS family permease